MKSESKFEGWSLTRSLAGMLLGLVAFIFVFWGWNEDAVRLMVRRSADTSAILFSLAFAASSLRVQWRSPISAWLLRNRRYLGVSFAISHFLHLGGLLCLGLAFPDPFLEALTPVTLITGGLAYLLITLMAATSFDRSAAWLGRRAWTVLHTVGGYYIWVAFAQAYVGRIVTDVSFVPLTLLLFAVLGLRIARRVRARRR